MKKYRTIFFDLDHTLWDFERNSHEAITELCNSCRLTDKGINDIEQFITVYREINTGMWDAYQKNIITKETLRSGRFNKTLKQFNIEDEQLAEFLSAEYLRICPVKPHLFPGTLEVLGYLKSRYKLHIITNGFREVQYLKIRSSGIEKFFSHIHISEEIGFKKPQPEIFHHAVKSAATPHEFCLMIGDNPDTDMAGAQLAGIDTLLFNPLRQPCLQKEQKQIHHLEELYNYL